MKNVTLAIDDELLEKSRALAGKRGTTLNAMVRGFLVETISQEDRIAAARRGIMELIDKSPGTMPPDYVWNRQEIYDERERRMLSRHERPDLPSNGEDE